MLGFLKSLFILIAEPRTFPRYAILHLQEEQTSAFRLESEFDEKGGSSTCDPWRRQNYKSRTDS